MPIERYSCLTCIIDLHVFVDVFGHLVAAYIVISIVNYLASLCYWSATIDRGSCQVTCAPSPSAFSVLYFPSLILLDILVCDNVQSVGHHEGISEFFDHSAVLALIQVCEQCQNVKYEREGYFVTVDIEKGMQDGQVSFFLFSCMETYGIFHVIVALVAVLLIYLVTWMC